MKNNRLPPALQRWVFGGRQPVAEEAAVEVSRLIEQIEADAKLLERLGRQRAARMKREAKHEDS